MTIDRLQVLWIDGDRRERHRIGQLSRAAGVYTFVYGDVTDAVAHGFLLLPEFPEVTKTYCAAWLFSTFADRVPSKKRPDRARILRAMGHPRVMVQHHVGLTDAQ